MSTEHMEELNDQQIVRREKMAALREQGIDPFRKTFLVTQLLTLKELKR